MGEYEGVSGELIYVDNAASSWPKPSSVIEAMREFMEKKSANPGRSAHRMSIEASRILYEARREIAALLNAEDPLRVVFCSNATEALNLALKGLVTNKDHVITTSIEHNSVMRPLRELEKSGTQISTVRCSEEGIVKPEDVEKEIRKNTRLIAINHGSNVTGSLLPLREIGIIARDAGLLLLVDAAQTAGCFPIDMRKDRVDLLAFTGHKSLLGPQGIGGLIIGDRVDIKMFKPLKTGGTGSRSEQENQPDFLPDKYESGTPNTVGAAGLHAGVQFIRKTGVAGIRTHEMNLASILIEGFSRIKGVRVYGPEAMEDRIAIVSINIEGIPPSELSFSLDREFGVLTRPGLHCAPSAHRTIGTFPQGTVRFSPGIFNTERQMEKIVEAVREIARRI